MSDLDALAKALNVPPHVMTDAARSFVEWGKQLGVRPLEIFKTTLLHFDATNDGRAADWKVRLRLYREGGFDAEADTDPEAGPEETGTEIVRGLIGVAHWAGDIIKAYHAPADMSGVEYAFVQKIPGLRPTLSRKGGKAAWRLPYSVNGQNWLARIDLARQEVTRPIPEKNGIRALLTELRGPGYFHGEKGADSR